MVRPKSRVPFHFVMARRLQMRRPRITTFSHVSVCVPPWSVAQDFLGMPFLFTEQEKEKPHQLASLIGSASQALHRHRARVHPVLLPTIEPLSATLAGVVSLSGSYSP